MATVRRGAVVAANIHGTGATGEHALDDEFDPVAEGRHVYRDTGARRPAGVEVLRGAPCTWCRACSAAAGRKRASALVGSRHRRAHFMRVSTRRGMRHRVSGRAVRQRWR